MQVMELFISLALVAMAGGLVWLGGRRGWWASALTPLLLVSLPARLLLALVFYFASLWSLPLLTSWHAAPGFWDFATDAMKFHGSALDLVGLWKGTYVAAWVPERADFELWVAALYWLLDAVPIWPTLVGAGLAGAVAWPLWVLARATGPGDAPAICSLRTALVALWPSAVLWSLVLTKDGLLYFAVFALLACFASWASPSREGEGRPRWWWLLPAAGALAFFVFRLRPYLGAALLVSVALGYGLCFLLKPPRPWAFMAWGRLLLLLVVTMGVGAGGLTIQFRTMALKGIELPDGMHFAVTREQYQKALAQSLPAPKAAAQPAKDRTQSPVPVPQRLKKAGTASAPAPKLPAGGQWQLRPEDARRLQGDEFKPGASSVRLKWIKERLLLYNPRWVLSWMQQAAMADGGELMVLEPIDYENPGWWWRLPGRLGFFFFRPLPWERFGSGGGGLMALAGVETLIFILLCPGILAGAVGALWRRNPAGVSLVFLGLGLSCVLSMVLLNLGAIVRLRLMAMLPLILLWEPTPYLWAWRRIKGDGRG